MAYVACIVMASARREGGKPGNSPGGRRQLPQLIEKLPFVRSCPNLSKVLRASRFASTRPTGLTAILAKFMSKDKRGVAREG